VVTAVDNHARNLLTSTTDVTIYVTDVNDNAPEFISPAKSSSRDVIGSCDVTVRVPYTTSADAVVTQVAWRHRVTHNGVRRQQDVASRKWYVKTNCPPIQPHVYVTQKADGDTDFTDFQAQFYSNRWKAKCN